MLTNRPLPPHLTIYKPQLTSTFPISHRISGAFLATMVLFSPLLCPKMGLISFTYENFYQSSPSLPKFILSAVDLTTLALCYHMSNGVRHLWRDFAVRLTSFFDIYRFLVLLLAFCLFSGKHLSPMGPHQMTAYPYKPP